MLDADFRMLEIIVWHGVMCTEWFCAFAYSMMSQESAAFCDGCSELKVMKYLS